MTTERPRRNFAHANNPGFACAEAVILLPFGRESYLAAAVELWAGERVELDETTDRIVYQLSGAPAPVTLVYSGMGGPATANALEMVAANGGRRVVLMGACGGVDPALGVGELLVADGAVRGEGTSRYYAPIEFPAVCDAGLGDALWREAARLPVAAHRGLVFTTDASYRQGPEIYETYRGLILGVESECATAAVAARRLGLVLGAVFFCTDNVTVESTEDRHYRGLAEPRIRRGFEAAMGLAVGVLGRE